MAPAPASTSVPARCADCKRRLRRPSPTGYGPVCARRRGLTPTARASPPAPPASPAPHMPGQTELPLRPLQPTLWSI
jgi:hypothetical protein